MKALTERHQKVLDFIRAHLEAGNPAPTIREICDHFDIRSTNGARMIVGALVKKGALLRMSKKARGLSLSQQHRRVGIGEDEVIVKRALLEVLEEIADIARPRCRALNMDALIKATIRLDAILRSSKQGEA